MATVGSLLPYGPGVLPVGAMPVPVVNVGYCAPGKVSWRVHWAPCRLLALLPPQPLFAAPCLHLTIPDHTKGQGEEAEHYRRVPLPFPLDNTLCTLLERIIEFLRLVLPAPPAAAVLAGLPVPSSTQPIPFLHPCMLHP